MPKKKIYPRYICQKIMSCHQYSGVSHLFPPAVYLLSCPLCAADWQGKTFTKKIASQIWTIVCQICESLIMKKRNSEKLNKICSLPCKSGSFWLQIAQEEISSREMSQMLMILFFSTSASPMPKQVEIIWWDCQSSIFVSIFCICICLFLCLYNSIFAFLQC